MHGPSMPTEVTQCNSCGGNAWHLQAEGELSTIKCVAMDENGETCGSTKTVVIIDNEQSRRRLRSENV